MATHVFGSAGPADLPLIGAATFDSVVEFVAPIVRPAVGKEEMIACAEVQCHRGTPAQSTAECVACTRLVDWRAEPGQLRLRCRWSAAEPVTSRMTQTGALVTVTAATSCAEADGRARARSLRHLLVLDGTNLVGIACRCDLVGSPPGAPIADRMTKDVFAIAAQARLGEAAELMRALAVGVLPVVSDGILVGVITRGDLRRAGVPDALLGTRFCARCGSAHGVRRARGSSDELCLDCHVALDCHDALD